MLLNMHDYNHQNGTHRELFKITEVQFEKFIDEGHHSHAYYQMPIASSTLLGKTQKSAAISDAQINVSTSGKSFPTSNRFSQ